MMNPSHYIRDNFHPADRLAVVCKNSHGLAQRIVTAGELASSHLQAWMTTENGRGANIYILKVSQ